VRSPARGRGAVVIGAGVNGLVAARYLARAGHRVLVLERRPEDDALYEVGWVPEFIARDLALTNELRIEQPDPWMATPLPQGGALELWRDVSTSVEAIRRVSTQDAVKWPAFCERMGRLSQVLKMLYAAPPPDVLSGDLSELIQLAGLGLKVRRMGKQGIVDLLRVLPMSVAELLDDWFETDALKAVLGGAGVMHLRQGPKAGGTAFSMLHHHVGSSPGVFRPPRSNVGAVLRTSSVGAGIEVRRGESAQVTGLAVKSGRVTGAVLASGDEVATDLVVSSASPRATLLGLVDPAWFDPDFIRAVRHIKCRGVVAMVRLELEKAPGFTRLSVAPSLDHLERAYDDAKYGRVSQAPYVEAETAGQFGNGRHVIEVRVQYAPHELSDGQWDQPRRRALGERVVGALASHVPELEASRVEEVLAPPDLEARYGFPEGHAYGGELTLDQILFMRPVPGWARYRTPIGGLYLCGAGTHPGGAIAGASGAHAARAALADLRRGR